MRQALISIIVSVAMAVAVLAQNKQEDPLSPLEIASPMYPIPAIHLRIEERIVATVEIDPAGTIMSSKFDRGAKVFHKVIENALAETKYAASKEHRRKASIVYVFTLLPSNSNSYITSVFVAPNVLTVFAKRIVVIDTVDRKRRTSKRK